MARERKIVIVPAELSEKMKEIMDTVVEQEKADQETSEMLKELEKKLFEKYLAAVHDAFKNIDPNTKFVDLLNIENAEEVRQIMPGEEIFSKNGTPLRP